MPFFSHGFLCIIEPSSQDLLFPFRLFIDASVADLSPSLSYKNELLASNSASWAYIPFNTHLLNPIRISAWIRGVRSLRLLVLSHIPPLSAPCLLPCLRYSFPARILRPKPESPTSGEQTGHLLLSPSQQITTYREHIIDVGARRLSFGGGKWKTPRFCPVIRENGRETWNRRFEESFASGQTNHRRIIKLQAFSSWGRTCDLMLSLAKQQSNDRGKIFLRLSTAWQRFRWNYLR
ncbi:hypothetical protein B0T19DRAFT_208608 [Cercophora scortea]|uniref:Uncharacterized protein n=1 Tax=Cercophora scortea TaxID=314031 RepID=A0AAE0IEL4_9PEZI|nr:hypothetical protein B0T19DRAFT_208608 [Cercophora scortea]